MLIELNYKIVEINFELILFEKILKYQIYKFFFS